MAHARPPLSVDSRLPNDASLHITRITGLAGICCALIALNASPAAAQVPPAGCHVGADPSVVNCTGNHSGGISLINGAGPFETLNVFALTSNITPASSTAGIFFTSSTNVVLDVALGSHSISTANASGILVAALGVNSTLDASVAGKIATSGNFAHGIVASTANGDLNLNYAGAITVLGNDSDAVRATSAIGVIVLNIAGDLTTSGNDSLGVYTAAASDIFVNMAGQISTSGIASMGLVAQTLGGSAIVNAAGSITTLSDDAVGIFIEATNVGLVNSSANISTQGNTAEGIRVASQQGSGVISTGNITTAGDNSAGIWAEALSGDVAVANGGTIITTGDTADGMYAFSATGTAAAANAGTIAATGLGSAGIFVSGNAGAIVLNSGSIVGGACCSAVMMDSATDALLINFGTISAYGGGGAVDIISPAASMQNYGTINGDIVIADGFAPVGSISNLVSGVLNTADTVTAATVTNEGTIAPGGRGSVQITIVGGDLVQTATGVYAVDLDPASTGGPLTTNDALGVTGSAVLAGKVEARFKSVPLAAAQTFTILSALGGLTDDGLGLIASPVARAALEFVGDDLLLSYSIDFSDVGVLNPNQRAIARNLQSVFEAGSGGVAPVLLGLLNTGDIDGYRNALDQLSPELYTDAQIATLYANLAFANSMLSCRVNGSDTASIIREGQCLWAGASARFLNSGTTRDQIGYQDTAGMFTAGVQVALDDVWRLGFAGGYQQSSSSSATHATSDGALGQAGVALKYNPGSLLLAATLSGGGASYDTTRPLAFGGFAATADGTADYGFINGGVRAAYVLGSPDLFWKPILDMNLTHIALDGFTESGGGGAGLTVHSASQTVFSIVPTVEVGSEFWLSNGTLVRPLVRGGAIWYSDDDFALSAGFTQAPAGVGPFTIMTRQDQAMGIVGAGLEVINANNDTLRINYDAQLGETTQIHSIGIRGSASF
ncbi:autotransporter domain-containing protein [Hyphomicrobium sp. D-2]|uniref:autotransporter outer membrane beta-barrel domain-containing protein n=1 Tax=Hyphomicrobium sp. D-2 TaxID=3041621 RepID=UPI00245825B2|nr:autotransporter domain-containing protein [Hyphomicrobium sp. D-2]MDH4981419.1 autotransporter domain-containing protein [Hyphomicrobium sp. D-2]